MKSFKISAIGTHGTGKSTTIYDWSYKLKTDKKYFNDIPLIKEKLNILGREPSVKIISEVASECPFPINKESTFESQIWMFAEQLKQEIESDGKFDFLLIDRSLYDYITYCHYLEFVNNIEHGLSTGMINIAKNIYYDILVKHEINDKYLKEDGIRDLDKSFQENIQFLLENIISKNFKEGVNYNKLIQKRNSITPP